MIRFAGEVVDDPLLDEGKLLLLLLLLPPPPPPRLFAKREEKCGDCRSKEADSNYFDCFFVANDPPPPLTPPPFDSMSNDLVRF